MKRTTDRRARPAAALCAALLALSLAACGGAKTSAAYTADMATETASANSYDAAPALSESMMAGSTGAGGRTDLGELPATAESSRKIVYNASLDLESKEFDTARQALADAVAAAGGYLESTSISGSAEEQNRYAYFTARIPADTYRSFLSAAGSIGSVTRQTENAQDITSNYIDVSARLAALTAQRDRLNELAEKAETTADLLEIESQLSDVQYEIENYTQQMRAMEDQISYSTVDLTLEEVATLTPVGSSFADRFAGALTGGWNAFVQFVQGFVLSVVFLLPMLVLLALAAVLAFVLVRRRRAARAAKKAAAPAQPAASVEAAAPAGEEPPSYRK